MRSIETSQIIDAYCLLCDVVWPVSAQERELIAHAVAIRHPIAGEVAPQERHAQIH
jgi:hypothetical protein